MTTKAMLSRRHFLIGVGAATAARAAAIVSNKNSANGLEKDNGMGSKKGYQLTEHVRNYYRTAKI